MKGANALLLMIAGAAVVAAFGNALGQADDLDMEQATYCEMVKTFKETKGQFGWPDFNNNADKFCAELTAKI